MNQMEVKEYPAKFKFSNGEIEISGSEEFVSKQLDEFKSVFQTMFDAYLKKIENDTSNAESDYDNKTANNMQDAFVRGLLPNNPYTEFEEVKIKKAINEYEDIFAIDGDKIQILCDIPGPSLAKRMINLILIYLWIKSQLNIDEVSFIELRDMCEQHGEIDKPNFAKHMHFNKKFFIINGSGKNLTAKLVRPGFKEAEHLIEELKRKSN